MPLFLMCAREGGKGWREKGPCEQLQGSEGDLQESICSSHYEVSGPELGSPGLSSKSFSLAERSHQINYIGKFYIKYITLEKTMILVFKNLNSYSYNFRNLSLYKRSYKTAFLGNTQLSCSIFIFQIYFKHKILPHLKTFFTIFYLMCECFAYTCLCIGFMQNTWRPKEHGRTP